MERVWRWQLADGESVTAKLDLAKKEESVFLGRRLVSRGALGDRPDGHAIALRSGAEGAYRGARDVRAIFDADGGHCRLLVDGNPQMSEPLPPRRGKPLLESDKPANPIVAVTVIAALVVGAVGVMVASGRGGHLTRARPATTPTVQRLEPNGIVLPPPPAPLTNAQPSTNALFTARYPDGFSATPTVAGDFDVVTVAKNGASDVVELRATAAPKTESVDALIARALDAAPSAGKDVEKPTIASTEHFFGTCASRPGTIVVRHLRYRSGAAFHAWTCAFLDHGRGFVFTSRLPADRPGGASASAELRRIIDHVEL
jgi:hypothetical protein